MNSLLVLACLAAVACAQYVADPNCPFSRGGVLARRVGHIDTRLDGFPVIHNPLDSGFPIGSRRWKRHILTNRAWHRRGGKGGRSRGGNGGRSRGGNGGRSRGGWSGRNGGRSSRKGGRGTGKYHGRNKGYKHHKGY